jgi:hypothetical protein
MPKIIGAHSIIYSTNADADRAFLRDVVGFRAVDAGGGWLIFALPPAELAVHPGDESDVHELYLLVDDVKGFVETVASRGARCTPPRALDWGVLTYLSLPSGGKLGVYQPRHARPTARRQRKERRRSTSRKVKPAAKVRRRPRR